LAGTPQIRLLIEMGSPVDRQKSIDIEFEGRRSKARSEFILLVDQRVLVEINPLSSSVPLTQRSF
jgi:hypothetical protein